MALNIDAHFVQHRAPKNVFKKTKQKNRTGRTEGMKERTRKKEKKKKREKGKALLCFAMKRQSAKSACRIAFFFDTTMQACNLAVLELWVYELCCK